VNDPYAPDWCERCGIHLALPTYEWHLGRQWRKPLVCPVCQDWEKRGR